jgi:hypothetical protein
MAKEGIVLKNSENGCWNCNELCNVKMDSWGANCKKWTPKIKKIEDMNFQEFSDYCYDRACDGQWSVQEGIACFRMGEEVTAAAKGKFFKKRAKEKAWKDLKERYSCAM